VLIHKELLLFSEFPASRLGGFTPWKEPRYPSDRMLD